MIKRGFGYSLIGFGSFIILFFLIHTVSKLTSNPNPEEPFDSSYLVSLILVNSFLGVLPIVLGKKLTKKPEEHTIQKDEPSFKKKLIVSIATIFFLLVLFFVVLPFIVGLVWALGSYMVR